MDPNVYRTLIASYLSNQIPTETFRARFNEAFQSEPIGMDRELFFILNPLWASLEAYSPRARAENESLILISEATLRKDTQDVLDRLDRHLLHIRQTSHRPR